MMQYNDQNLPFECDRFYHIFNRSNSEKKLFYEKRNYVYFLKKFDRYLSNYLHVYAYCLLPNHFHFLVKVKSSEDIVNVVRKDFPSVKKDWSSLEEYQEENCHNIKDWANLDAVRPGFFISKRFNYFFLGYAKAINKQQRFTGSLFQKYFRRKLINSDDYFCQLVFYIHNNPVHHGYVKNLSGWPFSSFIGMTYDRGTKLRKDEVLGWFGGSERYEKFHKENFEVEKIEKVILE